MQKRYTNPAPTREPGAVPVPESELALQPDGYRVELQFDQLHPRDIDPSAIVRKSEGELTRTYEAKSLLSAAIDQLAMDQMRAEQANENAARMEAIARDTHLPTPIDRDLFGVCRRFRKGFGPNRFTYFKFPCLVFHSQMVKHYGSGDSPAS